MLLLLPPLLPLMLLAPPHYDDRAAILEKDIHAGDEGSHPTKVTSFVDERETLGSSVFAPGFHAAILDFTQTTATIDIAVRAAAGAEQH